MPDKGSVSYQLKNVPATAQAIADALLNAAKDAEKVFTAPTINGVSYQPGSEEGPYTPRTIASHLTITIREG